MSSSVLPLFSSFEKNCFLNSSESNIQFFNGSHAFSQTTSVAFLTSGLF